jgi:hypothetical protein
LTLFWLSCLRFMLSDGLASPKRASNPLERREPSAAHQQR